MRMMKIGANHETHSDPFSRWSAWVSNNLSSFWLQDNASFLECVGRLVKICKCIIIRVSFQLSCNLFWFWASHWGLTMNSQAEVWPWFHYFHKGLNFYHVCWKVHISSVLQAHSLINFSFWFVSDKQFFPKVRSVMVTDVKQTSRVMPKNVTAEDRTCLRESSSLFMYTSPALCEKYASALQRKCTANYDKEVDCLIVKWREG